MFPIDQSTVLILAPHTDDGEFGCGGSIAKFIERGAHVYYAAFSLCEESVPEGWPKDILERELRKATNVWGIPESNLLIYRYRVRHFAQHRQEILEDLVGLQKSLKPTVVFMPSVNDLHQDHHVIATEGMRAFKKTTLLAYEMPWNNITFSTLLFIKLEDRHVQKKIMALKEYESQSGKSYAQEDFIKGLARTRGVCIDADYAESFEVVRWVIL